MGAVREENHDTTPRPLQENTNPFSQENRTVELVPTTCTPISTKPFGTVQSSNDEHSARNTKIQLLINQYKPKPDDQENDAIASDVMFALHQIYNFQSGSEDLEIHIVVTKGGGSKMPWNKTSFVSGELGI